MSSFESKSTAATSATATLSIPSDTKFHQLKVDFYDAGGNVATTPKSINECCVGVDARPPGALGYSNIALLDVDHNLVTFQMVVDEFRFTPTLPANYTYRVFWEDLD